MYYKGIPFNEYSATEKTSKGEAFFKKSNKNESFFDEVFERIKDDKIILVVYQEAIWSSKNIVKYHNENYSGIPYFTVNKIVQNVFVTTMIKDGKVTGFTIVQYDNIWRVVIEQSFDESHLLIEYRKMFYENENRVPYKEKIFSSSWHISDENYT